MSWILDGGCTSLACAPTDSDYGYTSQLRLADANNELYRFGGQTLLYTTRDLWPLGLEGYLRGTSFSTAPFTDFVPPLPKKPIDWFERINSGPPNCVIDMITQCPGLYAQLQIAANTTRPDQPFCPTFANTDCKDLCTHGSESSQYLKWAIKACSDASNSTSVDKFKHDWAEYLVFANYSYNSLFP